MPTPKTSPAADLTFAEYRDLVSEEVQAIDGRYVQVTREAYDARSGDRRCCCCGAYISTLLTGYYDSATCLDCGAAQEVDEDEYARVAGSRSNALIKAYTTGRGGNYSKRARLAVRELQYTYEQATFPTFAVKMVRQLLNDLNLND